MQPFFAKITPFDPSLKPTPPIFIPPGGIDGDFPTHPIVLPPILPLPQPPVDPGYSPPWLNLPVDPDYGVPIVPYPPVVDNTLPTVPGRPTHPIFIPPVEPGKPVDPAYGVDVDNGVLKPTHPIYIPDPEPENPPGNVIIIPVPGADVPDAAPEGTTAALIWAGPGYYPVAVYMVPRAQPKGGKYK